MLVEVERWLQSRMLATSDTAAGLERLLGDLLAAWPLVPLIDCLLADDVVLADIGGRSYRHDNGFDRIELLSGSQPEYGLRIHIWRAGADVGLERVHGHPWSFASFVMYGRLYFEQFIEAESGDATDVLHYDRPAPGRAYELTRTGVARLRLVLRGSMTAGLTYGADHAFIHRTWTNPADDAATLMLHGAAVAYPSRVFGARAGYERDRERHPRPPLTVDRVRDGLRRIRERLGEGTT